MASLFSARYTADRKVELEKAYFEGLARAQSSETMEERHEESSCISILSSNDSKPKRLLLERPASQVLGY